MTEQTIGLPPLVADFIGAKAAPRPIVEQIVEQLVEALDADDGDPDIELNGDEQDDDGDRHDRSWTEWDTRGRHKHLLGHVGNEGHQLHEDDEEDDPAEDDDADTGIEDDPRGFDPEEDFGAEEHGEGEQMPGDVPMPAVYSLDYDPFTDQRRFLGYSNLQSSFVSGTPVRSADSGAEHRHSAYNDNAKPGEPV